MSPRLTARIPASGHKPFSPPAINVIPIVGGNADGSARKDLLLQRVLKAGAPVESVLLLRMPCYGLNVSRAVQLAGSPFVVPSLLT
jgi:hypothetical protein